MEHNKHQDIQECGTHSVLLKNMISGEFLGFVASCKKMSCPSCGQRLTEYLKEQVAYYTQTLKLKHFMTLTTGTDLDDLNHKFSKITELLRITEENTYVKHYLSKFPFKKIEEAKNSYRTWVNDLFDQEHFYIWLYGKELSEEEKNTLYTPLSNIGFYVTEILTKTPSYIKNRVIKPLLVYLEKRNVQARTIDKYFNQNIEPFRNKWKGISYKDTKFRRNEFLMDFNLFILDVARMRYERIFSNSEVREQYREKIPEKGSKLSYIRALEFHKNKTPHFHSLTNYYVPIALIKKVMKYNVYDVQEIENLQSESLEDKQGAHNRDFNQYVASYLVKYITKSTLEVFEELKEKDRQQTHIISSSDNISIVIEDAFKSDKTGEFQKIKVVPGILRMGSKTFLSVADFDNDILPSVKKEHPNKPIQEIIEYLQDYTLKVRKKIDTYERQQMKEELKLLLEEKHKEGFQAELERRKLYSHSKFILKKKGKLEQGDLSEEQFQALKGVFNGNQISFLIGYAGSGKTYTLTKILENLDLNRQKVAVVSYAAKAKERVKEVIKQNRIDSSNVDIHTIHSLCGAQMGQIDYPLFYNDWNKPLPYQVVIIDEYSLIPLSVLINFPGALPIYTKVIFVGDQAQLNPVGSKNPLYYFENQDCIPIDKFELTHNFRSGEGINVIANQVRSGDVANVQFDIFDYKKIEDYKEKGYQIVANSVALKDIINSYFQKEKTDIQLRYNYNINDTVIITKNDRYKKYFNGEFAYIIGFDKELGIANLRTSESEFTMTLPQLNSSVEPSHAITIHKSQGSEFEKVLILIDLCKTHLTNRNLLYTAITRAKKDFVIMTLQEINDEQKLLLSSLQK